MNYDSEKEEIKVLCPDCGHQYKITVEAEVQTETRITSIKEV